MMDNDIWTSEPWCLIEKMNFNSFEASNAEDEDGLATTEYHEAAVALNCLNCFCN